MSQIAVMGSGSWGTAFALVLADAGHQVIMWSRRAEIAAGITAEHRNAGYLAEVVLPAAITATTDSEFALRQAEVVVLAVPAQALRANLANWKLPPRALVLSLAKGIELGTNARMSQVIEQAGRVSPERIAVVSGPNLAAEIAERQPSACVVASVRSETAQAAQRICHTPTFRPYTNQDVIGTEIAGATKNVTALAVGMGVGLGYGWNAQASVITRSLAETARLGAALGAQSATFAGLAGLGDLVATCNSPLSRNRTFGQELGGGRSTSEVVADSRQVAEGVKSSEAIAAMALKIQVEMPIVANVTKVIKGDLTPAQGITELMSRALGAEQ